MRTSRITREQALDLLRTYNNGYGICSDVEPVHEMEKSFLRQMSLPV